MDLKSVLMIFSVLILASTVTGFESGTEGGDLDVDFTTDRIWDLQASEEFEEGEPDETGPSMFYGSQVIETFERGSQDEYPDDENVGELLLQWVDSHEDDWGQGDSKTAEIAPGSDVPSEWHLYDDPRTGISRLLNTPHPFSSNVEDTCGTATIENGENALNCPHDAGLPDQDSDTGVATTGGSITQNTGSYSVTDTSFDGAYGNADQINYDFDMYVQEPDGSYSEDVTNVESDGVYETYTIDDEGDFGRIDFHRPSPYRIDAIYGERTGTQEIGSVQNSYTVEEDITDYETTGTTYFETCEPPQFLDPDDPDPEGCSDATTVDNVCTSAGGEETVSDYSNALTEETDTITDNNVIRTEAEENEPYSWSRDTDSDEVSVTVTYNEVVIENVQQSTFDTECGETQDDLYTGSGCDDCSYEDSVDEYESSTDNYESLESAEVSVEYEKADLVSDDTAFHLDPDKAVGINSVTALFEQAGFTNSDVESDEDIYARSFQDNGFFSHQVSRDDELLSSNPAVSVSSYEIEIDGTEFISSREGYKSAKIDGREGLGNGYVAVRHDTTTETRLSDFNIVGNTEGLFESEQHQDSGDPKFDNLELGASHVEDHLEDDNFSCPGESVYCVVAVDLGTADFNDWNTLPSDGVAGHTARQTFDYDVVSTSDSLGACKFYQEMDDNDFDLDESENVQCEYEFDDGGDPKPPCHKAYNRWHTMEGPAVDDEAVNAQNDPVSDHREGCVEINQCVVHGEPVSEGTVANVNWEGESFSEYPAEGYEQGPESPDWNVCLNINEDEDYHEFGGQWYDLDDPIVNEYLNDEIIQDPSHDLQGDGSELVEGASTSGSLPSEGADDIEDYWRENPFPQHDEYNPRGGEEGTALLADCHPSVDDGCADDGSSITDGLHNENGYFSFFVENSRDDDFHPQGLEQEPEIEPISDAVLTAARKYPDNNQLSPVDNQPGVADDYERYFGQLDEDEYWFDDTEIETDSSEYGDWSHDYRSVKFSYAPGEHWTVDSRGEPVEAWPEGDGTSLISDTQATTRFSPSDSSIPKTSKNFGNSLAVVADESISGEHGTIEKGEGFWIDPDNIRYHGMEGHVEGVQEGTEEWRNMLTFDLDITGADSGIGYDLGQHSSYNLDEGEVDEIRSTSQSGVGDTVFADIHWQQNSPMAEGLEPPVCGDDSSEFLLEEKGETINSKKYEGRYACANQQDLCVSYEGNDDRVLYEIGDLHQTNELGEAEGSRLKADLEVCAQRDVDDISMWWDQDYNKTIDGTDVCRENNRWERQGVRWIDSEYIGDYPLTVTGGIDDSWNNRLDQMDHPSIESDPLGDNWDPDENPLEVDDDGYSPVPTGSGELHQEVALPDGETDEYGFCAGDDESEYLIHQQSRTRHLDTNQEVIGVGVNPDQCVLGNDLDHIEVESDIEVQGGEYPDERKLYDEGDTVEVEIADDSTAVVGCFGGEWWSEWPIAFLDDSSTVTLGDTGFVSFMVINPEEEEKTFDLLITDDGDLGGSVRFEDSGSDEMEVTVPRKESNVYRLEVEGTQPISGNVEVYAESQNPTLEGFDDVDIEIQESELGEGEGEVRSIPGLTMLQVVVIGLLAIVLFFFRE